jgi:hypothetical protein
MPFQGGKTNRVERCDLMGISSIIPALGTQDFCTTGAHYTTGSLEIVSFRAFMLDRLGELKEAECIQELLPSDGDSLCDTGMHMGTRLLEFAPPKNITYNQNKT